jgi:hypothetical protein
MRHRANKRGVDVPTHFGFLDDPHSETLFSTLLRLLYSRLQTLTIIGFDTIIILWSVLSQCFLVGRVANRIGGGDASESPTWDLELREGRASMHDSLGRTLVPKLVTGP